MLNIKPRNTLETPKIPRIPNGKLRSCRKLFILQTHLLIKVIHKASTRLPLEQRAIVSMLISQAHGQGQDFSSAENSDSSADEDYRATNPVASKVVESVYWADSEEEKEEKGEVAMKSGKEKVKCFR